MSQLKPPLNADDHVQGPATAKVKLVEYGDYECPHCARAYPVVKRVQEKLGDKLQFAFRNFPLAEMHPHATAAAELAEAAALQGKFWPMHDLIFENQNALSSHHLMEYAQTLGLDMTKLKATLEAGKVQERVRADFMSGVRSGVNGTPSFFVNGERFDGNWTDEDEFAAALINAS